ncbi:hypothetical protein [Stratiformator vulcanicus]|uniref:Uncharacterized protein n=1 Tax=Stratiformator vulcanicus TaxID=2527980 RepID=A0A517R276_9PLAN|nr:hypothetical protein [Stratiformator vulcanicus]QDT37968.1 hypothetical protein Pan189_23520 [Stratiformator vulcanicus]
MTETTQSLATRFFWTFALVTFFGTLAAGFYGVGIVWMLIATPFLARWYTQSRDEMPKGSWWPAPIQMLKMFGLMIGIGVLIACAAGGAGFCTCLAGMNLGYSSANHPYGNISGGLITMLATWVLVGIGGALLGSRLVTKSMFGGTADPGDESSSEELSGNSSAP